MENAKKVKDIVREKYGQIAVQSYPAGCGCGCGCGSNEIVGYTVMNDEYKGLNGYLAEADLNLGCGMPTELADIKEGDTVIDLGSGAGNDVFVARAITGEKGRVIGVDFTPEMVEKARKNRLKLGYQNVEFKLGEIEDMPIESDLADVVISNCVLNLVPDKNKAFSEIYRILKPGGHFCVSDIVLKGKLPEALRKSAEMYAGCVAGAIEQEEYLQIIADAEFKNIKIQKSRQINFPENILTNYINLDELESFKASGAGIFSITVYAEK